ncbi:hypothetical protein Pan216_21910 [Planctomycetes bacterium Pan216]|uniref:Uncharacterized protein n=1 Tax=Kolteria novifilia TaxID=2527975 RepID=A0A518B331_9BACT|nr:hypothetical protein Pan216_21910 [Planctomycetes bacterium Pan216]
MPTFTQKNRFLSMSTPLGADVLAATGYCGREGLPELYRFEIDAVAVREQAIDFGKLLTKLA